MDSNLTTEFAADEETIRAIHQGMIDAWNAGDAAAFAAPFTEDATIGKALGVQIVAGESKINIGVSGGRDLKTVAIPPVVGVIEAREANLLVQHVTLR
jgi:hypothetical protein